MHTRMTQAVKANRNISKNQPKTNAVQNFMGGVSYKLTPIETLQIVSASSIFGEPQFYRNGQFATSVVHDGIYEANDCVADNVILGTDYNGMNTSEIMEQLIDDALSDDFEAVLEWAITLRQHFMMRLNPQVIMVRAAMHPNRKAFTSENPGHFARVNNIVMSRADDIISQITYYLYINGSKQRIPGVLKRSWQQRIEAMTRYSMGKYKNAGIGMIDAVRITHAKGPLIDELMRTGTVQVATNEKTWEALRSQNKTWTEIINQIRMPYMALLRNLRGIFREINDPQLVDKLMAELIDGVESGKQFPFRYMSAYDAIKADDTVHNSRRIMDGLETCMDRACVNLPKLPGKSAFLSDNSGSAWGTCTSEYGKVTVAEIDNLSAVIGAVNSDEGHVYPFGDDLLHTEISKREGILQQARQISRHASANAGAGTENGIWLFFRKALDEHIVWDNIFIYSDQQAGHGGLYGTRKDAKEYSRRGFAISNCSALASYIDVAALINEYRRCVNPKVNVFTIQTAGYDNVLIPENSYRTSVLYGWTGKELVYADIINKFWDDQDKKHGTGNNQ